MKVLVTGSRGQLGAAVVAAAPTHWEVVGVDRATADMRVTADIRALARFDADVIVNCAAYTDVDAAQSDEATCWAVNAQAPAVLCEVARGARLLHVSTDYVFDGQATTPYSEDAPVTGIGVYGRSKAAGETVVRDAGGTVVRTAWLYAPGPRNFVATMLRLAQQGGPLPVVDDQVGQPTYALDVATRLVELVERGTPAGTFHATNTGQTSWCGFAREILRLWGSEVAVEPVTTADFPRPAPRPAYSVLGQDGWKAVGLAPLRSWREALAVAHAEHRSAFL